MRRVPRTPATHNLFGHAQSKLFDGPALVLIEALSRHLDPGCAVSHQKNLRPRSQEPQRAAPRSSAHLDAPARSCRRPADDRRQIRTGRSLPASTGSGPLSLFPAPACLLVVSCKRAGRKLAEQTIVTEQTREPEGRGGKLPHSQARLRAVRPPPHAHETAHGAARTVRPPPVHTTRRTARDGGRRQRFRGCQLVGSICARHRCVAGAGRQRPCCRLCACQRSRRRKVLRSQELPATRE